MGPDATALDGAALDTTALDGAALDGAHVAILGWAGARERQLRPVVRWYEARGARPFTTRARVMRNMSSKDGWEREGRELALRVRARLRRDDAPMVFHLFSNAGFWTYAALLRELEPVHHGRIAAAIVDSAPGFPPTITEPFYTKNAARAFMPMVLRRLGKKPAFEHPVLTPVLKAWFRFWFLFGAEQRAAAEDSLRVARDTGAWPLLFVYSVADSLVSRTHVEAFVATIGDRGLFSLRFEDSPHVLHVVKHRQRYFREVEVFLRHALAG